MKRTLALTTALVFSATTAFAEETKEVDLPPVGDVQNFIALFGPVLGGLGIFSAAALGGSSETTSTTSTTN